MSMAGQSRSPLLPGTPEQPPPCQVRCRVSVRLFAMCARMPRGSRAEGRRHSARPSGLFCGGGAREGGRHPRFGLAAGRVRQAWRDGEVRRARGFSKMRFPEARPHRPVPRCPHGVRDGVWASASSRGRDWQRALRGRHRGRAAAHVRASNIYKMRMTLLLYA